MPKLEEQYSWPGRYLVEFITSDGDSLCAACALLYEREVAPWMHEAGSEGYTCDECGEEKR